MFVDDLRRSVRAIARVRWLAPAAVVVGLCTAALGALGSTPIGVVLVVAGPAWIVVASGWLGTERVVIVRAARGEELHGRNVWASVQVLGPRIVRLALLLLPLGILLVVTGVLLDAPSLRYRVVFALVTALAYATLTFVTPALVLTTSRVRDAVPIGWRLLRATWRETWGHAIVPAAVFAVVALVAEGAVAWVPVIELVALTFRGATTLRYTDLVDVAWRDVPGGVWRRRVTVGTSVSN